MASDNSKVQKVKWEDETLSDFTSHAGWKLIKDLAKQREEALINAMLSPAKSEWEALSKESVLASVREIRGFFEAIETRAERFRKDSYR